VLPVILFLKDILISGYPPARLFKNTAAFLMIFILEHGLKRVEGIMKFSEKEGALILRGTVFSSDQKK